MNLLEDTIMCTNIWSFLYRFALFCCINSALPNINGTLIIYGDQFMWLINLSFINHESHFGNYIDDKNFISES